MVVALRELIILIASFAIASLSAEKVVESAVKISNIMKIRKLTIGILLVSISTSIPELMVAIFSGMSGKVEISVGNILGSTIFNVTIIFSLLIFRGLVVTENIRKEVDRSASLVIFISLLLLFVNSCICIYLFLIVLFFGYIIKSSDVFFIPRKRVKIPTLELIVSIFKFLFYVSIVVIFSKIGINYALDVLEKFDILPEFLGSTLIAFETSLPELLIALQSIKKYRKEISIGDIMGSNVVNMSLILGLGGIMSSVSFSKFELFLSSYVILVSSVLIFLTSKDKLDYKDSILFCSLFVLFLAISFYFNFTQFV